MKIKVRIPLSLQNLTGQQAVIECSGSTIDELINELGSRFPELTDALLNGKRKPDSSFLFFVNGKMIKIPADRSVALKDGDEFMILQLVAGG